MSFAQALVRQQAAIFDRLGEDAGWTGISGTVRVIFRHYDEDARLGQGSIVSRRHFIRVRKSEVAAPASGNIVTPQESGGSYKICAEPMLNRKGVWECEAVKIA